MKGSEMKLILFSKAVMPKRSCSGQCSDKNGLSAPLSSSCGSLQDVSSILWTVFRAFPANTELQFKV